MDHANIEYLLFATVIGDGDPPAHQLCVAIYVLQSRGLPNVEHTGNGSGGDLEDRSRAG
ncbi:MAG: hypothetical protein H6827_01800 [Planctomycetes bacterium]|nr:hypothetical protein [Planctomycetota bacterium]